MKGTKDSPLTFWAVKDCGAANVAATGGTCGLSALVLCLVLGAGVANAEEFFL